MQVALDPGQGIPVSGGVGAEFAERTAVRAALAWLRLATAGDGDVRHRRCRRGAAPAVASAASQRGHVGRRAASLDGLRRLAGRVNTERDAERIEAFADDIERLQRLAVRAAPPPPSSAALRDSHGLASTHRQPRHAPPAA